jgi:CubicO group peptidase (beta-lactamase class C family)
MIRHFAARAFLFVLLSAATPLHAQPVDGLIRDQMAAAHIPAVSVAVLKDGKPVLLQSYGIVNLETGTPVTNQTAYKIASLSKAFIADSICCWRRMAGLAWMILSAAI